LTDQEHVSKKRQQFEAAVWAEWDEVNEWHPSPVKEIARRLRVKTQDVATLVYPVDKFGPWFDHREPDLTDEDFDDSRYNLGA
jgi:hypothetical protein